MQNIVKIKEVLDSINSITSEYRQCQNLDHAEQLNKNMVSVKKQLLNITSAKKQLLDIYTPEVSKRFSNLDPKLHSLLQGHFTSLVLAIGDLQQVHDTKVRHVDPNVLHNLLLTHIHPIIKQIDSRLLAMHATLQGISVVAKRNP